MSGGRSKAGARSRPLSFSDLLGWKAEDHEAALAAFRVTVDLAFPHLRRAAEGEARAFFETHFKPVVQGDGTAHFTGYYEPEIAAARRPSADFVHPIHAAPSQARVLDMSRAELQDSDVLHGLEIAWLPDAVEAFFLQVQGSGRLRFADGGSLRVGFAAKNTHPYLSIGQELIRRGEIEAHRISAERVKAWVRANGDHVLRHNPSFVFFKVLDLPEGSGPLGAMDRPVTPGRSMAVDPAHVRLGSPVWTVVEGQGRLMIAQDIGSAIQGPGRGDLYFGTGVEAGRAAGALNTTGFMAPLEVMG